MKWTLTNSLHRCTSAPQLICRHKCFDQRIFKPPELLRKNCLFSTLSVFVFYKICVFSHIKSIYKTPGDNNLFEVHKICYQMKGLQYLIRFNLTTYGYVSKPVTLHSLMFIVYGKVIKNI